MIRYTAEQKEAALARMAEIGPRKTQQELGISLQTLYKWRTESGSKTERTKKAPEKKARKNAKTEDLQPLLNDTLLLEKLNKLQEENARLIETNMKLKKALLAMMDS